MKTLIISILFAGFLMNTLPAQEVDRQLNEAHQAYQAGKLQDSRHALQQALHDIDLLIGAEILKLLPQSLGQMETQESEDHISSMGIAGILVSRNYVYNEGEKSASVNIMGDSPMLAGVNALLSLPVFIGDSNQKRIRVGGQRALLQKNDDGEGGISWDVQVPMGTTLLSFNATGFDDENTITEMVNSFPVEEIARLTR